MSHGDKHGGAAARAGRCWRTAPTRRSPRVADPQRRRFGVQFHPEVVHTPRGTRAAGELPLPHLQGEGRLDDGELHRARDGAHPRPRRHAPAWSARSSGGVDSTVTAALVHRAIGDQLTCIFVDNGVLRRDEAQRVMEFLRDAFHFRIKAVDAGARFLERLPGVEDPEQKRRIIGGTFIEVFEEEARALPDVKFLAQGTLYPDVIESVSFKGPSATIKSHHNVGGLPERMHFELVEPLRELFKDEVRELGAGARHSRRASSAAIRFPGPAWPSASSARSPPSASPSLQAADAIVDEEIRAAGLYDRVWQAFAVLLPVKTVGVMGDERTYENVLAIRAVESVDGMTADWARLPADLLARHVEPHHQRGARRQPRGLRHLVEAAGDDRVGVRTTRNADDGFADRIE